MRPDVLIRQISEWINLSFIITNTSHVRGQRSQSDCDHRSLCRHLLVWILRLDLSSHLHTGRPSSDHQDRVCSLDLNTQTLLLLQLWGHSVPYLPYPELHTNISHWCHQISLTPLDCDVKVLVTSPSDMQIFVMTLRLRDCAWAQVSVWLVPHVSLCSCKFFCLKLVAAFTNLVLAATPHSAQSTVHFPSCLFWQN